MSQQDVALGPWRWRHVIADRRVTALILETKHRPVAYNDPVIFAVREDWLGPQSPEREAAKQIIVAAPDLLAAARDMIAAFDAGLDLPWGTLRVAVAKAEDVR